MCILSNGDILSIANIHLAFGCTIVNSSVQSYYSHHLIPPKINHPHRNAPVFPWLEGERDRAAHMLEGFGGDLRLQCPLELLPGVGVAREKRLADVEGLAVVVCIQEPGRHIFASGGMNLAAQRVVDVHSAQLHAVRAVLLLLHAHVGLSEHGEDLTDAVHLVLLVRHYQHISVGCECPGSSPPLKLPCNLR